MHNLFTPIIVTGISVWLGGKHLESGNDAAFWWSCAACGLAWASYLR